MKRIVIGGGSGFVGRAVQKLLLQEGYSLTIVSRNPEKVQKSANVDSISWKEVEQQGLPACESVVQLAGELLINPARRWNAALERELYESRVQTTFTLRNAIARAHTKPGDKQDAVPRTFILVTGVGYYKPDRQTHYDEDSEGGNFDFLSKLVTDWESSARFDRKFQATLDFGTTLSGEQAADVQTQKLDVHTVSLRAGMVLGVDGGAYSEMRMPFRFGLGTYFGDGQQPQPFIHVADLAGLILHAIRRFAATEQKQAAQFTALNAVAPQLCTNREFADAFARSLGYGRAYFSVPNFVTRYIFGEVRANVLTEGARVAPKRTLELGYRYRFPDINSTLTDLAAPVNDQSR